MVMVVAGYVGPLELETPAQYLFHQHGGFQRRFEASVLAGPWTQFCGFGDGNAVFRRAVFEDVGLFAEDLGPGTAARSGQDSDLYARIFAAGYRISFDPGRIVWHRDRADYQELRRAMSDYAGGSLASATRLLLRQRDPGAVRVAAWWCRHLVGDLVRIARDDDERVPADLVLAEAMGMLAGPWRLLRSARSRGRPEPLRVSPSPAESGERRIAVVEPADPPLSVAIASYNRRESLAAVLDALGHQTYPADRFEVVVVVDGSSDGTAERVRGLDLPYSLRLLEQENLGLAASRNRGVAVAAKPVVLFLDDDIMPEPSYLAEHAAAHRRAPAPHVALAYCPPVVRSQDYWALGVRAWWEDFFRRKAETAHQWTFYDLSDGTASLPRDLLLESGGFDEELKDCQDEEFGLRLLERGVPFAYYPAARAWHHLDTTLATALRGGRKTGRANVELARKHPHVKGRLGFAYYATPGGGIPRRYRLAYRHAKRSEQLIPLGLRALDVLEALELRRLWRRVVDTLWVLAYTRGMRDALPSPAAFEAFVASIPRDAGDTLSVNLDRPAPLRLPSRQAPVEISVACDGAPLARIPATEPGKQWSWDGLTARLVAAARPPLDQDLDALSSILQETGHEPTRRDASN